MWQKNEAIREQRWKQKWEARLAAISKHEAKVKSMAERIIRQRTWAAYKADPAVFIENAVQIQEEQAARRQRQQERRQEKQQQREQ